ncbi:MAG TPA: acyl-CoA dehydrogenase [Acidimicrobiia bacterium]|nr:acyl-CoA dehydrogenase [Acidimicrobiia bacterium]
MALALTEDHRALAAVVRSFVEERGVLKDARARLDGDAEDLPAWWPEVAGLGWLGLHLPEAFGGQGYGLAELAVVVEELGRAVAPGPFLPTVIAAGTVAEAGGAELCGELLPALADGTRVAAVGLDGADARGGGEQVVIGGGLAQTFLLRHGTDLLVFDRAAVRVTACPSLDPTRPAVRVAVTGDPSATIAGGAAVATRVARALAAAEAAGGTRACLDMAVGYALVREQFGRVIGSFQAVKHHCAELLVDAELSDAAAWDAVRGADREEPEAGLAAAVAATIALPAFRRAAETNIQIHGGIGYTWEHDAHLYLRRASGLAAMVVPSAAAAAVASSTAVGTRLRHGVELPSEAETFRAEARAFRARYDALPEPERRAALIESGYAVPHWPEPWGRGAGAVEQLVIEEELAGVETPQLGIGAWILLTLVQQARPDQVERWVPPSLRGEMQWCQLFSEPNAGSDAAAISTRATRVEGGWLVNGQKVWTSGAQHSTMGFATVRTDPDAPKHAGVTTMAIDMRAEGVTVRPLREITGETMFNEVFLDDVFVPDDDVVGEVGQGWAVARATLGNERVSIGRNVGSLDALTATDLIGLAARYAPGDAGVEREVGALVAEEHAMASLNLRAVTRAVSGEGPGAEGNVTKLLSGEHTQRVAELGMRLAGPAAASGAEPRVSRSYLFSRCLTIAGGTSEIVRNVIAERLLRMPRDPLAK